MRYIKRIITLLLALALFSGSAYAYAPEISDGQANIVKRARQLSEIQWAPIQDIYQWNYQGIFEAGTTYAGLPYGQPVSAGGYVGWNIGLDEFVKAAEDNTSKLYTGYSWYNKIAPYYSMDCSAFVSYAWNTGKRFTTYYIQEYGRKVAEQNINAIEVGDALNRATSHVVLVTAVDLADDGSVQGVEITESTDPITRTTGYGTLGENSLDAFNNRYFNNEYILYRSKTRDNVQYTHKCVVPIDGDYCENCADSAPTAIINRTEKGRELILGHSDPDAVIYYTTDGSEPTPDSPVYTEPLCFDSTVTVRAIADTGSFYNHRVLTCEVSLPHATAPAGRVVGYKDKGKIERGSKLILTTDTEGAQIYYSLNGGTPTAGSKLYTGPISIDWDMKVKAIAVSEGYSDSNVTEFKFETISPPRLPFRDVAYDAWYRQAVGYAYRLGLYNGTSDDSFSPDGSMTRGMFATVLSRMAEIPEWGDGELAIVTGDDVRLRETPETDSAILDYFNKNEAVYITGRSGRWCEISAGEKYGWISEDLLKVYDGAIKDLEEDTYYTNAVKWACLTGIISAEDGKFRDDESITRQDMALMLYNYAMLKDIKLTAITAGEDFSDGKEIAEYAHDAVYTLRDCGVINGMGDGTFDPDGTATRAQVAQIFLNFGVFK